MTHVREVRSPFDGRTIGEVPIATAADVERALARGSAAAEAIRRTPRPRHLAIAILEKAAAAIAADAERLARLIEGEAGKPITYARVEVARCVDTLTTARDVARTAEGEVLELGAYAASADRLALVRRAPVGLVSAITPFNFPLNLVAHKLAPAIAAGCPVVLKPSPQAPLSAFALVAILKEAGLPDDHLSIVAASNEDATPLVTDPRPRMLTFTGSAKVGWQLRARCGEKRCTLELGGNAAVLVHDDADLAHATARIVAGSFGYAGQSCISVQRVLVHRRVHDELRSRLFDAAARLTSFDPARDETVCGPVIDDTAVERIQGVVREAERQGARLSRPLQVTGHTIAPFFLEGVPPTAKAASEELFAPGAILEPYDDFEQALDRADSGKYGLQSGLFTRDVDRVLRAWQRLEVGAVIHDDVPTFRADAMPYGGVKASGVGREGPASAFAEMTESRLLLLRNVSGS
jgi:acyl-CoA reductase-like NAD-dependent aldehyde dehydrogenase